MPCPAIELEILHQCSRYVAIDKPPDMRIDGGKHNEKAHEPNALALLRLQLPEVAKELRHCHQLDYATSGIMLYAISKKASAEAGKLFETRAAKKEYLALLSGSIRDRDTLECAAPICQDPENDFRMICGDRDVVWPLSGAGGKCAIKKRRKHSGPAKTKISVLGFGHYKSKPITKVLIIPQTGRRHQIRVHCLALGHPIVGDASYSAIDPVDTRMMLHAHKLTLPFHEKNVMVVTAPDPFTPERLSGLEFYDGYAQISQSIAVPIGHSDS